MPPAEHVDTLARHRASERLAEQLDDAAGRAFRLYLAARSERRSPSDIAALKNAYEAALERCRSVRQTIHIATQGARVAA